MCNCQLKKLPLNLLRLRNLQSIEFANNQLVDFYEGVAREKVQLDCLNYLSLNGNALEKIPSILKYLPKLQQLHMHMNRLTDIREMCRKNFKNLEVVDVGNNKIRELPVAFVHFLCNLNLLNIQNNDLEKLPNLIGLHKTLKTLQVDGNPLKAIRRPIIDKGTESLMKYLRDKYVEGTDDVIEEWAIEMGKEEEEYSAKHYEY